jgi:transposase
VLRQLDRADDNWWNPQHPAGPPTFKKRSERLVVPFPGQAIEVRRPNRTWAAVRLPKLGWVRFRMSRPLDGMVRNATVTCDGLGWHVSFGVATGAGPVAPNGLPGCGVDFGVACSAWVSDEPAPRLLPPTLTVGEQRRLLGLERRKARQLRWAKSHGWIGIEDLRAKGMAPWFRSQLRLVPPAFTSQTCVACGHRAHADHNAARNIERIAAGLAVDSTRSHPRVARPARSRTREPLGDRVA